MSEQEHKKEIRRLRNLLIKMGELAEHMQQTGSFESGVENSVRRYNAIVTRLEEIGAIPEDMFSALDKGSDSGQLGADTMLLAHFLEDMVESSDNLPTAPNVPDYGTLIALAPFLGSDELSRLVRSHFPDEKRSEKGKDRQRVEPPGNTSNGRLDMKTLVSLAPHMKSRDLSIMVQNVLLESNDFDTQYLIALAPHLNADDLSRIMHTFKPAWFGEQPDAPAADDEPVDMPVPSTELNVDR